MFDDYTPEQSDDIKITSKDMVNKPAHYNFAGIEAIDALRAMLGKEGFKAHCAGTVLKYIWRRDYKGKPLEDLKKAAWYLDKLIKEYEA